MNWISKKLRSIGLSAVLASEYAIRAMHAADKAIFSHDNGTNGDDNGFEQTVEKKSVYQDLLRGEVTEEVKELRHEMYYSERESYNYDYLGSGLAKKIELRECTYKLETSDDKEILIVQDVNTICDDLQKALEHESGSVIVDDNGKIIDSGNGDIINLGEENKNYTINIERGYISRFKIEENTKRIVIKKHESKDDFVYVDFYILRYEKQFDKRSHMFHNELRTIINGNRKSEITDFDMLQFISDNAFGVENLKLFIFDQPLFLEIIPDFEEYHVLRFIMHKNVYGQDLLDDIYYEATAEKCNNKEMRDGAAYDFNSSRQKGYNAEEASNLAEDFFKEE